MSISSLPLLPSVPNFRDMGGYQSSCGRTVRHGLIYRSADFSGLSEDDQHALQNLKLRLLCDVRSESERLQTPTRWIAESPLEHLHLNVSADLRASHEAITELLSGAPTVEHATQAMLVTYGLFPAAFANRLSQLFERLFTADRFPAVFHCAAGKDRTGFIAAILLTALDVQPAQIYTDYLLTAERWKGPASESAIRRYLLPLCDHEPPDDVVRTLAGVSQRYLDTAFATIDREFGGINRYLERVGLDTQARNTLKALMLM